jgi:hypothetical protein
VLALRAGVDLLLVSGMLLPERDIPGLLDSLVTAGREGRLDAERTGASLARLASLKERYLQQEWRHDPGEAESLLRCPEHLALLEEVTAKIAGEAADAVG